ncbi:hypothetical protein EVAR_67633_1 [Eumeta japonica]|uniref:Peptidase aspartic putative domain-containing protein n=1 Tax=Eumeta variegata TaxID=151549 RepID=A0A4C2AAP9_EUMVA|nr:hypothetical protein EVAR_67633_1 [Eumeta japonica]
MTKECIHGLKAQGLPVDQWDAIIVHILLKKLDHSTQALFEQSLEDNKKLISLSELLKFIEHRFQALETRGKSYESGITREVTPSTATKSYRQTQKLPTTSIKDSPIVATTNKQLIDTTCVLLATARIKLVGANGRSCIFQALLDSGSQKQATSQLIERFWKLEDTNPTDRPLSLAEKRCEDHFAQNIKKADGRFVVRLPFSENPSILGRSKTIAFNRFLSLEKRLNLNPELRTEYHKFMKEYESLGHMEEIEEHEIPDLHYVMPHHCVLKPESSTTKLRVVFDASAKLQAAHHSMTSYMPDQPCKASYFQCYCDSGCTDLYLLQTSKNVPTNSSQ